MSFNEGPRLPTSYAELQGVEVKIAEKYRYSADSSFMQQVGMACMTLKDLSKLDKYEYNFEREHLVLQNFSPANTPRRTAN